MKSLSPVCACAASVMATAIAAHTRQSAEVERIRKCIVPIIAYCRASTGSIPRRKRTGSRRPALALDGKIAAANLRRYRVPGLTEG
jgi:hypothetical protein